MNATPEKIKSFIIGQRNILCQSWDRYQAIRGQLQQSESEISTLTAAIAKTESADGTLDDAEMEAFVKNSERLRLFQKKHSMALGKEDQARRDLLEGFRAAQQAIAAALDEKLKLFIDDVAHYLEAVFADQAHDLACRAPAVITLQAYIVGNSSRRQIANPADIYNEMLMALNLLLAGDSPCPTSIPGVTTTQPDQS